MAGHCSRESTLDIGAIAEHNRNKRRRVLAQIHVAHSRAKQEQPVVSILESYMLQCTRCGKTKKVSRLHVHGNLAEIERTWVCPTCLEAARGTQSAGDAGQTPAATDA